MHDMPLLISPHLLLPERQTCRHPRPELRNLSLSDSDSEGVSVRVRAQPHTTTVLLVPLPSRHITMCVPRTAPVM